MKLWRQRMQEAETAKAQIEMRERTAGPILDEAVREKKRNFMYESFLLGLGGTNEAS